jgi:CspA family cold shock protein
MRSGTVKWFNESQGFGFIRPTEGGDDVFVDYRAIQGEGFRTLKAGQNVRFRAERGHLGVQATEVTVS